MAQWTVDLGSLPSFQHQASIPQPNGFYTGKLFPLLFVAVTLMCPAEFELGLSVDSAEVRGVLIYDNQEVGDIVFDFLA
jgi:hypothetical protein